MFIGGGEWDQW